MWIYTKQEAEYLNQQLHKFPYTKQKLQMMVIRDKNV